MNSAHIAAAIEPASIRSVTGSSRGGSPSLASPYVPAALAGKANFP